MPCNPNDNSLNPSVSPPIPIPPGSGIPFAPVQIPIPGLSLPTDFPISILDLINQLKIQWPGGELDPQLDDLSNNLLKAVASLFQQMAPFLSLYNLIMAAFNMIMCIIDVLCAINNPVALVKAFIRLIKNCLPPFLSIFPFLALLIMILSFLLLLLALILYIINKIIQIFKDIIANLKLLANGITLHDAESTAATAVKIASLLCILDDLMALFSAIAAIMAIIEALSKIAGHKLCSPGDGSDCCDNNSCPPFLLDNPNGISGTTGTLYYYKEITGYRKENWQFVNTNTQAPWPFNSIVTPESDHWGNVSGTFWPEGTTYAADSNTNQVPYTLDFTLNHYDPLDGKGPRDLNVKKAVVTIKPYNGVVDYNLIINHSLNNKGTLNIAGGLVFETDGSALIMNGAQVTVNTLIHQSAGPTPPVVEDTIIFSNLHFTLNINDVVLMGAGLISLGCIGTVRQEMAILNNSFDGTPAIDKIGVPFPDIAKAQKCVSDAINTLRKNVTADNAELAQAQIIGCLTALQDETLTMICKTFNAAVDIYKTQVTLDVTPQFNTRKIKVTIDLEDATGININSLLPTECFGQLSNLTGHVTFGEISAFEIDPLTKAPIAYISSPDAGKGVLTVTWNGDYISRIINRDNNNIPTAVEILEVSYTFVAVRVGEGIERRDSSDAAGVE